MTKKRNHAEALPNISTFTHFQDSDFGFCIGVCILEPCKCWNSRKSSIWLQSIVEVLFYGYIINILVLCEDIINNT